MALTTPTEVTESGEGAFPKSSASFTPPADALLIAVAFHLSGNDRTFSCSDSWGNSYSQVTLDHSVSQQRVSIFYARHTSSGSGTITVTASGTTTREGAWFGYVEGQDLTTPVINTKTGEATTSTTPSITLDATPAATSMVFAALSSGIDATGSYAPGSGFTEVMDLAITGSGSDMVAHVQYNLASAGTTVDWSTADISPSQQVMVAIEIVEAAAAGPSIGELIGAQPVYPEGALDPAAALFETDYQHAATLERPVWLVALENSAEGGTDEVTVSTANSGGASGDAWDTVNTSGGVFVYDDDTPNPLIDAMSFRLETTSANQLFSEWDLRSKMSLDQRQLAVRMYLRMENVNASVMGLWRIRDDALSQQMARLRVNVFQELELVDSAGSIVWTSVELIPTDQTVRLEMKWSNTEVGVRLFLDPDSTTPDEEVTQPGTFGTLPARYVQFFHPIAGDFGSVIYADNTGLQNAYEYLGPRGTVNQALDIGVVVAAQLAFWDPDHSVPVTAVEHITTLDVSWLFVTNIVPEDAVQTLPVEPQLPILAAEQTVEDFHHTAMDMGWFASKRLKFWLDASQLALSDGDPVSTWPNLAGFADVTAAGAARPTYRTNQLNQMPVVDFDGTDDTMEGANPFIGATEVTIFAVAQHGTSVLKTISDVGGTGVGGLAVWSALAASQRFATGYGTGAIFEDLTEINAQAAGLWDLLESRIANGSPGELWVHDAFQDTGANNAALNIAAANIHVGSLLGSLRFHLGGIAEIRIYDFAMSESQRQAVELELLEKWFDVSYSVEAHALDTSVWEAESFLPEITASLEIPEPLFAAAPVASVEELIASDLFSAGELGGFPPEDEDFADFWVRSHDTPNDSVPPVLAPNESKFNSSEGGTDNTNITVGNSGGASGDAWDNITFAAPDRFVFSAEQAGGTLSAAIHEQGNGAGHLFEWNFDRPQNRIFTRVYLWLSRYTAASESRIWLRAHPIGSLDRTGVGLQNTGNAVLENVTGSNIDSFPVPLEKWFRIEVMWERDRSPVGTAEWRVFLDPNSATPDHTGSDVNSSLGSIDYDQLEFELVSSEPHMRFYHDDIAYSTEDWLGPSATVFPTGLERPSLVANQYTGITPEYPYEGIEAWVYDAAENDVSWLFPGAAPADDSYIATLDIWPDSEVLFPPVYEAPSFTYDSEIVTNDGALFDLVAALDIWPDMETFFPSIPAELPQTYEAEILLNDGPLFPDDYVPSLYAPDQAQFPPPDPTNDQPLVDTWLEAFYPPGFANIDELMAAQSPEDTAQHPQPWWDQAPMPETIFFFGTEPPELLGAQLAEDTARHEVPWWDPQPPELETILFAEIDPVLVGIQAIEDTARHESEWWDPQADLGVVLLEAPAAPFDPALIGALDVFMPIDWPPVQMPEQPLAVLGVEGSFAGPQPVAPSDPSADRRRPLARRTVAVPIPTIRRRL